MLFVLRYYFKAVASCLSVLQIYTHTYATNTMTHGHFVIKKWNGIFVSLWNLHIHTHTHTQHNYAPLFFLCVSYINRIHLENIFSLQRFFEHSTTFFKGKIQKRLFAWQCGYKSETLTPIHAHLLTTSESVCKASNSWIWMKLQENKWKKTELNLK